jgi:replicative DNA helicase
VGTLYLCEKIIMPSKKKNMQVDVEIPTPHVLEIEQLVLGALLLEKDAILDINQILKPESFYSEKHRYIYEAILELSSNLEPVDIITVKTKLKKKKQLEIIGGAAYLSLLQTIVSNTANLEYHAKIVAQKYIQRQLISVGNEIIKISTDESNDVADMLDHSEKLLFEVAEGNIKKETQAIKPLIDSALKQIQEAGKNGDFTGVPSGFTDIDRITNGWQPSDLIIIAARPSMGKTAFVLSMAKEVAKKNFPVAIFSLEMSDLQLVNRIISSESRIPAEKIRTGKLTDQDWKHLEKTIQPIIESPLYIDDTAGLNVFELRSKCRRLVEKKGVRLVIIDYLQLMNAASSGKSNREQEVSMVSRSLKELAKELNIPIIALSQLNRSVEIRSTGHKRPQLSDLRESGAIEQDADIVMFIHRPERMGITEDAEGNSTKGLAEIIIAKHRNGQVGDVKLRFIESFATFTDFDNFDMDANINSITMPSRTDDEDSFDNINLSALEDNNDVAPF